MTEYQDFSEEASGVITDGLSDLLAQRGGGMLTDYIAVVEYLDEDGDPAWGLVSNDHQSFVRGFGLLEWARQLLEHQLSSQLSDN